jgi:hypothetical protein
MGHVWLARDERTGLDVALKMVAREGRVAERAEREARAAAALRHPRCQRIYALAHDVAHTYIAYEYVPGRTLRQALSAGELGPREVLQVAVQVLDALAHAHGRGIVHRDVKPSNVLLGEGEEVDARLLDFGLAQMAEFETLTAIGDVPGTLTYVSPERLRGEQATPAADVWAVGVMVWESLAGEHPFRGETTGITARRILAGAPPIESVRSDVPAALRATLARALALDPRDRPSAAALADELRRRPAKPQPTRAASAPKRASLRAPAVPIGEYLRRSAPIAERVLPAASAALWTGWVTTSLPFYPAGWPLGLTVAAGALGLGLRRFAFPFALAVTFFPLANVSLGLACLFALLAAAWTALTWGDPRGNAIAVAGPLLGPIGLLPLLPVASGLARNPFRRAAQTATGVLLAAVCAGIDHRQVPFATGGKATLELTATKSPGAAASALVNALTSQPHLLEEALLLGLLAAALPYLRGRLWIAVAVGAALLTSSVLLAGSSPVLPLVIAAAMTGSVLALVPSAPQAA